MLLGVKTPKKGEKVIRIKFYLPKIFVKSESVFSAINDEACCRNTGKVYFIMSDTISINT